MEPEELEGVGGGVIRLLAGIALDPDTADLEAVDPDTTDPETTDLDGVADTDAIPLSRSVASRKQRSIG